jgi:hypothetical protein
MEMGFERYLQDDSGRRVAPETREEWRPWVSASGTRNFVEKDTLLDWLREYGRERGFVQDDELPGYDERTDFSRFIMAKGQAFEAAVVAHLGTLVEVTRIEGEAQSLGAAERTWEAMVSGRPVIHQAILRNPEARTYGAADLLVRSDVLAELFPGAIPGEEVFVPAPALGLPYHYRVIDVKFTTLHLDRHGHAGAVHAPYMVQTHIYNQALGRIQGFEAPVSYLLGRGWEQGKERGGDVRRGTSCMERLAPVKQYFESGRRVFSLAEEAREAVAWVRRLRAEGAEWQVLPRPSVAELWPNLRNPEQGPWHGSCVKIAKELEDLSLVWRASPAVCEVARGRGIERWTDPRLTAEVLQQSGCYASTLDALLAVNRAVSGDPVRPAVIRAAAEPWARPGEVEFFVDFETVNNLDDDFSHIPEQHGQPLIFMIGCGHFEDGEWQFACFTAEALEEAAEAVIIEAWLKHMEETRLRVAPGVRLPRVFHWSPAEAVTLTSAYNSARERHQGRALKWAEPLWFDFLGQVVKDKAEPLVVRGAFGFGLKAIGKALHSHGLIATGWDDSVTDGLGAMTAAWSCAREAIEKGISFPGERLMHEVRSYNEIDCKVMAETIAFCRGRAAFPAGAA